MYVNKGAFLNNIEWFDNTKFRISDAEAKLMDPQQRLLLETTYETLGVGRRGERSSKPSYTGVYVGCMTHDFETLLQKQDAGPYTGSG